MGENVIICQLINGVRFIDKTKIGGQKKRIFRFDVWVNKSIDEDQLWKITEFLKKIMVVKGLQSRKLNGVFYFFEFCFIIFTHK